MIIFTLLREAEKELDIIKSLVIPSEVESLDTYYGMNVSPSLKFEPLDQLDGFLVAKYIQKRTDSRFYPFIAGGYEALNSSDSEEAKNKSKSKREADERKRGFLENIMQNLGLRGRVYTTYDLWDRQDYWEIFKEILERVEPSRSRGGGMLMGDFPKELLGTARQILDGKLDEWNSTDVYVPAEVTEAVWFNKYLKVNFKIGPEESEKIYDDIIRQFGIGIIGLTQPLYRAGAELDKDGRVTPPRIVRAVPYIGKKGQNRVFFSDNLGDILCIRKNGNPSFDRALSLARTYRTLFSDNGSEIDILNKLLNLGERR